MTSTDVVSLAQEGTVHFVGIGGAGMCALAELLLLSGGAVSGCDLRTGAVTDRLGSLGASISHGHDPSHLEDVAAVVVTTAVPVDHPELLRAEELGIPVIKRADALGGVVNRGRVVAIAGTHGKTSTTAMATEMIAAGGLDPTGFVGGTVPKWHGNLRRGGSDLYVVEADEFDRSFHALEPDVAVVTNLEADHLDIYTDLDGVRAAFRRFLTLVRPEARVAICGDDGEASRLLSGLPETGYSYGLSAGSQLRATEVEQSPDGTRCRVIEEGEDRGHIGVRQPGLHNLRNALGAAAAARHLGVSWDEIREGLEACTGVGRRFQRLGEVAGIVVIDDYAHHPTEIRATLAATRAIYEDRRLIAVFEPHLYTRTRDFREEFGQALAEADLVFLTDIYPARESPIEGLSGESVVRAVESARPDAVVHYQPELSALDGAVAKELASGDVVVVMGAGSIERVAPALFERLKEASHA